MGGRLLGDYKVCGFRLPHRETTIGAKLSKTIARASLDVDFTWGFPPRANITGVSNLEFNLGDLDSFECNFSRFPNWIQSNLERYCPKIGTWLVGVTSEYLVPLINEVLKNLLG